MTPRILSPRTRLKGEACLPGDKSISHRSVMLGSIATGTTRVSGFLAGDDPLATLAAFQKMGVKIERPAATELVVRGVGLRGLKKPGGPLDVGNSGTTIRLLSGILAGQDFESVLDGDASIRRRPMKRVMEPLLKMGAKISDADGAGHAPLKISGGALKGISFESPVASAQVKSAVLLAGLYAGGKTCISEPAPSRDHTERMLRAMGVTLEGEGTRVCLEGGQQPKAADIQVPVDISSAAFFLVGALIAKEGEVVLRDVGVNPTRDGIIEALRKMGGRIALENRRDFGAEPVADLRVKPSKLKGATFGGALIPRMIDEIPALTLAAAFAEGETLIQDAAELRVKESDRIATMTEELGKLGIQAEAREDGMRLVGDPARSLCGGSVSSHGDHRVAMTLAMASLRSKEEISLEDTQCVETSFPGFFGLLERLSG